MTAVISTRALVKQYGRLRAVDGIDLEVQDGDVYGFLGANGSGKTTTVRMLLGLVLPTSGEIELLGERMPRAGRRVLPRVGALIEGPAALRPPLRPGEPVAARRLRPRRRVAHAATAGGRRARPGGPRPGSAAAR